MTSGRPPLSYKFDGEHGAAIPLALKQRRQWVCWQARDRIDKRSGNITGLDKIPIDPKTNPARPARINQPSSWGAFNSV